MQQLGRGGKPQEFKPAILIGLGQFGEKVLELCDKWLAGQPQVVRRSVKSLVPVGESLGELSRIVREYADSLLDLKNIGRLEAENLLLRNYDGLLSLDIYVVGALSEQAAACWLPSVLETLQDLGWAGLGLEAGANVVVLTALDYNGAGGLPGSRLQQLLGQIQAILTREVSHKLYQSCYLLDRHCLGGERVSSETLAANAAMSIYLSVLPGSGGLLTQAMPHITGGDGVFGTIGISSLVMDPRELTGKMVRLLALDWSRELMSPTTLAPGELMELDRVLLSRSFNNRVCREILNDLETSRENLSQEDRAEGSVSQIIEEKLTELVEGIQQYIRGVVDSLVRNHTRGMAKAEYFLNDARTYVQKGLPDLSRFCLKERKDKQKASLLTRIKTALAQKLDPVSPGSQNWLKDKIVQSLPPVLEGLNRAINEELERIDKLRNKLACLGRDWEKELGPDKDISDSQQNALGLFDVQGYYRHLGIDVQALIPRSLKQGLLNNWQKLSDYELKRRMLALAGEFFADRPPDDLYDLLVQKFGLQVKDWLNKKINHLSSVASPMLLVEKDEVSWKCRLVIASPKLTRELTGAQDLGQEHKVIEKSGDILAFCQILKGFSLGAIVGFKTNSYREKVS